MAGTKKLTKKYWDSLEEGSRYRALRKVFSNFSDTILKDYARMKANEMDREWGLIVRHVKQPIDNSHYKTCIDNTYIP